MKGLFSTCLSLLQIQKYSELLFHIYPVLNFNEQECHKFMKFLKPNDELD